MKIQLSTFALLVIATSLHAQRTPVDGIAATVNDQPILWSEVNRLVTVQSGQIYRERGSMTALEYAEQLKEIQDSALEELINRKLILNKFEESKGQLRPLFVEIEEDRIIRERYDGDTKLFYEDLNRNQMTRGQFRRQVRDTIVVQQMRIINAAPPLFVTPQEMKETYEASKALFRQDGLVSIRTISIHRSEETFPEEKQKALAESIREKLVDGGDFASMARTYSQDYSAKDGGLKAGLSRGDLSRKFGDLAFSLPIGEVSPIVETVSYFVILRVESRQEEFIPPLKEVENQVRMLAIQQKRKKAVEQWLDRLRADAVIEIFERTG